MLTLLFIHFTATYLGPDVDELDEAIVDADGKFELNGSTNKSAHINPALYIVTDCQVQSKVSFLQKKRLIQVFYFTTKKTMRKIADEVPEYCHNFLSDIFSVLKIRYSQS